MNEYIAKYKLLSQLLDDNPQLVSLVHRDLAKMLSQSKRGRGLFKGFKSYAVQMPFEPAGKKPGRWKEMVESEGGYIFCCWFAIVVIMVIMSREQGVERQR